MVKKLLLVLFPLMCYGTIIYAQNKVHGVLLPKSLINHSIILFNAVDSTAISSAKADEKCLYSFVNIPKGHYYIKFTAKGFNDFITENLLLTDQHNTLTIDTIILEPAKVDLKEVVVIGETPILERKDNVVIFNVAKSAFSSSINGIELLQMLPSVNIGDNSLLTISGKSNVAVYINGKPSNIQGANLLDYLKNIQSNNIDKIEITNGANAAADAGNNGGIINIKFKTATHLGYSTNLSTAGSLGRNYAYSGGLSISHKSEKNTWFINFDYQNRKTIDESFLQRNTPKGSYFDVTNGDTKSRNNYSLFFGNDYAINKQQSLGFSANAFSNKLFSDEVNLTQISNNGSIDSLVNTSSKEKRTITNLSGNLNYNYIIGKKGANFSADFDFLNYNRKSVEELESIFSSIKKSKKLTNPLNFENLTPSSIKTYSAKADLKLPLTTNESFYFGAKAINVGTNSSRVINLNSNYPNLQIPNTLFNYQENVFAGYINYLKTTDKNKFEIGLRFEQTIATGDTSAKQKLIDKNFLDFFPNISYTKIIGTKNSLSLSYRKGIVRPRYEELNPFFAFLDPFTYSEGNPQLNPMYNHALRLAYTFKDNLNIAFIYNNIKGFTYSAYNQNLITNVITSAIQNYNYRQSLGVEGNMPFKICSAYSIDIFGQAVREYFKYTNKTNEVNYNESNSFSFNLNHQIKLPFKFNSNITMVYESATVYGIYTFKPLYYCNIGVSKNILSGKASLKLSLTDPFDTKSNRYSTQAFDLDVTAKEKTESRSFRLAFTYQIGRKSEVKKLIKTDEQNRIK